MMDTSGFSAGSSTTGLPEKGSLTNLAPELGNPSVPPNERTPMNGSPWAPAWSRYVITTFEYSYVLSRPSATAFDSQGPKPTKPMSTLLAHPDSTSSATAT